MSGVDTEQTKKVRSFKDSLTKLNIPILFEDERLSSVSAKKSLIMQNVKTGHNKAEIDRTAAAIILQQFLQMTTKHFGIIVKWSDTSMQNLKN